MSSCSPTISEVRNRYPALLLCVATRSYLCRTPHTPPPFLPHVCPHSTPIGRIICGWCKCCLCRGLKTTTGIVGLEVDPQARETVQTKAEAVLDAVKVINQDVQYRKNVEATFQFWLKQVRKISDPDERQRCSLLTLD